MPNVIRHPCFDSALPGYAQHKRPYVRPERSGAKSKGLWRPGAWMRRNDDAGGVTPRLSMLMVTQHRKALHVRIDPI